MKYDLEPHGPVAKVKCTAAVMKLSIFLELPKCLPHTNQDLGLDIQLMVCRKHSFYRQCCNFFKRSKICGRVSRRVIRK